MAHQDPAFSSDSDFPADSHEAAKLQERLQQLAASLDPGFWGEMKRLLHTADLLHINL